MALDNYADLQAAVARDLFRTDLTNQIIDWIFMREQEWNLVMKRREMTQLATASTVANQDSYALPTDFGEAMEMHINNSPIEGLEPGSWNRIKTLYQSTGIPQMWSITDDQFLLGPTPNDVYTIELYYYKVIPNLSSGNTTNWLLTNHPQLYYLGAMSAAADSPVLDMPQAAKWKSAYEEALKKFIKQQVRDRGWGGGPMLRTEWPLARGGFNITSGEFQ